MNLKILSISFSMLLAVFLITPTPLYAADNQEIGADEYSVKIQPIAMLYLTSQNEFLYFKNEKLYNYLAQNSNDSDQTFDNLANVPTDIPVVIYVQDHEVLQSLSPSNKQTLKAFYDSSYFMGVGSQGGELKSLLDVKLGSDFETAGEEFDTVTFFIHKNADGVVNELLLGSMTSAQDILRHLMLWYNDLYPTEMISRTKASPSGAWDASYTADYRTQLKGGTSRFLVSGFKLKSPADKPDYYLVTTSIQTDITSHSCKVLKGNCGWYTNEMYLSVQVDTSNGGKLFEYMPTGSVGSVTRGITIGASLTTASAGISAAYSESYSISDATYIDNSDFITNNAKWTIRMRQPDYTFFPFITDAPNVARNSYETSPVLIIEVPKDQCAKMSLFPLILQQNDSWKFGRDPVTKLPVLRTFHDKSFWHARDTPLPKTVICGT